MIKSRLSPCHRPLPLLPAKITVKNIHIRYEDILSLDDGAVGGIDGGTSVPRPLSAGVTLRKLVAQTVDENWTPTYVQEASAKDR